MTQTNSLASPQAWPDLVLTRTFNAPRALVFKAWTDPAQVALWWGPHGFTNPVCEMDVRPGGAIRIDMRGPDGTIHPMRGTYQEVVEPERLVLLASAVDEAGRPLFVVRTTATFKDAGGRTEITVRNHVLEAAPEAAQYLAGMEPGWVQNLERFADYLGSAILSPTADREILMTRMFHAPRERVFTMWTDPEHVVRWWGPTGFTTTIYEMDVRPGGLWRFVMHGPDGIDYQNHVTYVEVAEPERLVYDHEGGARFRMSVTFEDWDGRTRLTAHMLFPSAAERERVIQRFGAVEGLKQTLERLAAILMAT